MKAGKLTTHVLDTSRGLPAQGMRLRLYFVESDASTLKEGDSEDSSGMEAKTLLCEAVTNEDGRLDEPLLQGSQMKPGIYELLFYAEEYFMNKGKGLSPDGSAFLERIPVRFRIDCPEQPMHVPLLIAPGGYSTYRGS